MNEQSLFGMFIGALLVLMILPFVLEEHERRTQHTHTVEEIPYGMGLKSVYVTYCHDTKSIVDQAGKHKKTKRSLEIWERYELER